MSADSNTPIASFKDVEKKFGDFTALKKISFEIQKGEVLAFLGPNGAGKSTSLKLLTGLRRATSGEVRLFGKSPTETSARKKVGMTPQELDFPPQLKVSEVLKVVALAYGEGTPEKWKTKLHLEAVWNRKTLGLSGGEKRRLGLACALMAGPDLLLLDEPTTGLDVESRRLLWDVIREEQSRGVTICLTTHYLEEIEKLSTRVIVIDHGEKLFEGSVQEIRRKVDLQKVEFECAVELTKSFKVEDYVAKVLTIETKGKAVTFWTRQSDALVREMVQKEIPFEHLSVHPASLEEAFINIRQRRVT